VGITAGLSPRRIRASWKNFDRDVSDRPYDYVAVAGGEADAGGYGRPLSRTDWMQECFSLPALEAAWRDATDLARDRDARWTRTSWKKTSRISLREAVCRSAFILRLIGPWIIPDLQLVSGFMKS